MQNQEKKISGEKDEGNYYNYTKVVVVEKKKEEEKKQHILSEEDTDILTKDCDSLTEEAERLQLFYSIMIDKDFKKILLCCYSYKISFFNQLQDETEICAASLQSRLHKLKKCGLIEKAEKKSYSVEAEAMLSYNPARRYYGQLGDYGYILTPFARAFVDKSFALFETELNISFVKNLKKNRENIDAGIQKIIEQKKKEQEAEMIKINTISNISVEETKKPKCIVCHIRSDNLESFDSKKGIYYCIDHDIKDVYHRMQNKPKNSS